MYLPAEFCQDTTLPCNIWHNGRPNPVESFVHAVENVNWNFKMRK